jgi:hypothetical protein
VGLCFVPGRACCNFGRWSRIVAIVCIVLPMPWVIIIVERGARVCGF